MTTTTKTSAILADVLAQFSKALHSAFTEIENQSRLEASEETREARAETKGWKQVAADAKAALRQAELTIARQAENIESQLGMIAELRRELSHSKDQSRNWQEHFNRAEQERCAQSSRIDELLNSQRLMNTTLSTPPSYTSSALNSVQKPVPPANSSEEVPQTPIVVQKNRNPSLSKRKTKVQDPNIATAAASSLQRRDQTPAASRTTLIRRVQAVVHVKREQSEDGFAEDPSASNDPNYEASDTDELVGTNQRRSSRRNRKTINDSDDIEQRNPVSDSRHLRHLNASVNYREEDDDEDDDDELNLGAEDNHAEVYGTRPVQNHATSVAAPPPKKKRKVVAR